MRRREFITLLGGTAAAWPLATRAQQGERIRRIGVLSPFDEDDAETKAWLAAFQQGCEKLGWSEGSLNRRGLDIGCAALDSVTSWLRTDRGGRAKAILLRVAGTAFRSGNKGWSADYLTGKFAARRLNHCPPIRD